jgi:RNA polymerase sigma factor (sigma-70 family)
LRRTEGKIPEISDKMTRLFVKHDRVTLKEIYAKHYPAVENYIQQNSGNREDAKDIFQEAITAAWLNTREGKFTPQDESALGGYIFRIAKYKWLDKVRSKAHRSTVRMAEVDDRVEESEINERDEKLAQLRKIYGQLGERCQSILNKFYYSKMSLDQIGEEMGFDAATVKTQKYRCMKKLRTLKNEING